MSFSFSGIFWVDATDQESAESRFRTIAEVLEIKTSGDLKPTDAVKRYLSISDNWLLLIDNADNPKHNILDYMPSGNTGSIIITSRNPEVSEYASHVDTFGAAQYRVEKMESEEAMVFLEKASRLTIQGDPNTKQDSEALIKELGYLALTINQAGAYMRNRNCTIKNYLGILQKQR
ncbi:hypothetical protein FPQ18DRAFT_51079 [Pyronema domesticum]|nr:hypothetical protein FPQ18DRAFT_51079 [Pyronema domesticum]